MKKNPPVCVISGEDDGTLVFKPRLDKTTNAEHPRLVVDIRTAEGVYVATGVLMSQLAKLEEFMTYAYDWRRHHIFEMPVKP